MSRSNYIKVICPSVTCIYGEPAPTPSTVSTHPYTTHPFQRLSITLLGNPMEREPRRYSSGSIESFWSQPAFDEETAFCAFEIWDFLVFKKYPFS